MILGDKRRKTLMIPDRSHGRDDGTQTAWIERLPSWTFALPYPSETFCLVAFDLAFMKPGNTYRIPFCAFLRIPRCPGFPG